MIIWNEGQKSAPNTEDIYSVSVEGNKITFKMNDGTKTFWIFKNPIDAEDHFLSIMNILPNARKIISKQSRWSIT